MQLSVARVFVLAAATLTANSAPLCQTANNLQDLVNFGSQGCTLPGSGRIVGSWTFDAHFLVSGLAISASAISAEVNPANPPATETPTLFNYLFRTSIPVPNGDTLVLSLAYDLNFGETNTPVFYYVGLPDVGSNVSDSSALCVGGQFTGAACSGTLYMRSFNYGGPIHAAGTGAVNHLEFTDTSSNQFTLMVPGSGEDGISSFGVAVASFPPVPEPPTFWLLATAAGVALIRVKLARSDG